MAKRTFLQLCQATARECGVSGNGPASIENQIGILHSIINWVAAADQEVCTLYPDWDFLNTSWSHNTIEGVSEAVKPADLGTWDTGSFSIERDGKLSPLDVADYREWRDVLRYGENGNAVPGRVVVNPGGNLTFWPTPNGAYAVSADYWRAPARMADNSDTSLVPEQFERIIISRAKIYYAEEEGAPAMLMASQVEYNEILNKLRQAMLSWHAVRASTDASVMQVVVL